MAGDAKRIQSLLAEVASPQDLLNSKDGSCRADLSAHVDFAAFAEAAHAGGAATWGPVPQRRLLTALGAAERAAVLSARATSRQRQALDDSVRRLLDPDQMGILFQAIALTSPGMSPPPAVEADP